MSESSYKGWTIRGSASLGFFKSGRGGKVKKSFVAYKGKGLFAPTVHASSITELKKHINAAESKAKEKGFWDMDIW